MRPPLITLRLIDDQLEFTTTFYRFQFRYMALGGITWSFVYMLYAWALALYARIATWDRCRVQLSDNAKWHILCLVDARDEQKRNQRWLRTKLVIVSCVVALGLVCFLWGLASGDGFAGFIGATLLLYWFCNVFATCNPAALKNLRDGDIPLPGMQYHAHRIMHKKLTDKAYMQQRTYTRTHIHSDTCGTGTGTDPELGLEVLKQRESCRKKPKSKGSKWVPERIAKGSAKLIELGSIKLASIR